MSIYRDILKVMTCLTVIGLTAAPVYAQQSTQQLPCNQQNAANCMQGKNPIPSNNIGGGGGPYSNNQFDPARNVTPNNPTQQNNSAPQDNSAQQK